jgi:hypothetical protein
MAGLTDFDIQALEISMEEQTRLESVSPNPCPACKGVMLVGADECFGICDKCIEESYAQCDKDQSEEL